MSNVKVNGNSYADISSLRLPLADGSGYAVYKEGQSQEANSVLDLLMTGDNLGDYTDEELTQFNPGVLTYRTFGTWNLPNVVRFGDSGNVNAFVGENLLLPNVTTTVGNAYPQFRGCKISGVMDCRKYNGNAVGNPSLSFFVYSATIGTLRLDSLKYIRGNSTFGSATITNLVLGADSLIADDVRAAVNGATAITNLYITDAIYDDVAALISAGTITKVTNLHKYSEWSDD